MRREAEEMTTEERETLLLALGRLAAEAELQAASPYRPEPQREKLKNRARIFRLAQEEILS